MSGISRRSRAAARHAAEKAARTLGGDPRVRLVYLFGSAADDERSVVGDVDVAVLTDPRIDLDELLRLRADVVRSAGAPIDLVSLNHASVVLAKEIADTGVCLYAASDRIEVDFVTRARARYWDFKPFLEEQWRRAGERIRERARGSST